jgi:6,7-dimethyl-8-ribityllumazine synthase
MNQVRVALIVSTFNPEVTEGLAWGAREVLRESGISEWKEFKAPGAFELPLLAQTLARSGVVDAVVCLGCVIKGDTAHFEFISLGTAVGIQQASLETGVPISFGVLTTYTDEQAWSRSRKDAHNKGREAAAAALGSVSLLRELKTLSV